MRGATGAYVDYDAVWFISIHAPHAGCDDDILRKLRLDRISIHAPHAGCDAHQGGGLQNT